MLITRPALHTKVRLTLDNSRQVKVSCVWCPPTEIVEGTIYYSNPWDGKDTIRLICTDHTIKFPVVPLELILKIEVLGKDVNAPPLETHDPGEAPEPRELVFTIESSSKKGDFYRVTKRGSFWACSCVAGLHGKACRHVKQAQAQVEV